MNTTEEEEKLRQLKLIHKLAERLPWMLAGFSLLAFILILIEILVMN